ncbi:MAG: MIP/aquaporin family protein [Solirubrobacteraceae bacterium]
MPVQESPALALHDPQRAHHLLMLELGSRTQFDDPKLEYRRLFSELLGTFFLVVVAAGGGILHGQGQISLTAAVVAPGLMVLAIILFVGAVSGAHLNPAVTLTFAMRGDFPWKRVPGYIIIQLLGATLACLFLLAVFGNIQHLGATLPGPGYKDWQAFLMEIALTAGLLSVILGTASVAQNVGALGALGVGGYIALAGLWAAPVSGTSMNLARRRFRRPDPRRPGAQDQARPGDRAGQGGSARTRARERTQRLVTGGSRSLLVRSDQRMFVGHLMPGRRRRRCGDRWRCWTVVPDVS